MDKKILIVALVAIIAIAAVAAFVLMNNNGNNNSPSDKDEFATGSYNFAYKDLYADPFDYEKQTRLAVLGNANNDTNIDSKDIAAIRNLIKNGDIDAKSNASTYAANYYADANNDGKINEADAKYVQGMIDGKVTKVFYEKILDGIGSYTPAKKTYLIPVHRCYGRTSVMLANASENITIVGGCTQMAEDEFFDVIDVNDSNKFMSVGTSGGSTIKTEAISTLAAKYSDGNVVVMTGGNASYCSDYESKGTHAQYIRFITWEGDALTGLLTAAYLIDGVGNSDAKAGTGWGKAKEYETWYMKYIDMIKAEGAKVSDSDKKTIVLPYLASSEGYKGADQSTPSLRGNNTSEQVYVENAGGKNVYYEFGESNAWGRVSYTKEQFANLTTSGKCPDVVLFMPGFFVKTSARGGTAADVQACENGIAASFARYISSDSDLYIKTWCLNGIPMIMDQICIAKALLPDNAVIKNIDMEKVWNEYLTLYGVPTTGSTLSYDNVFIMDGTPFHANA